MTNLQYMLYSFAAALIKAGESLKDSADNVPTGVGNGAPDEDGVIATSGPGVTNTSGEAMNTNAPAFDASGCPWDERIHSGAKSLKGDGTWTRRKNTPPTVVSTVEAELKAQGKWQGGTVQPTSTTPPTGLPIPTPLAKPGLPVPQTLNNYQKLCQYLAANTGANGKPGCDDAWVATCFAALGVANLASLATNEVKSAEVLAAFQEAIGA